MIREKFAMLKSSFLVSAITTLSTVFAFAVQLVLARKFGASLEMDAYFAAVAIPLSLIRFISLPLHFVFIPMYKEVEEKKGQKEAADFHSLFFWGFLIFFLIVSLLVFTFSQSLANLIVAGAILQTKILTAGLLKTLSFYIFFAGTFFITQVLHVAKKSFTTPYLANAVSSFVIITYTFFFIDKQGIYAAIYGLLFGAIAEAIINLLKLPVKISLSFRINRSLAFRFLKLFIPFMVGMTVYKSTPIIERYFASFLSKGDISIMGYANKIIESMVGFLATGLSLVLLPATSELSAKNENQNLSNIFSWGVRVIGFLVLPVIFYLGWFSRPFISVIFERGNFSQDTSSRLGTVMVFYLGAILALSLGNQLTNIFYGKKKHMTVVWINIILMPLYIFLLWFLSGRYGVFGIAASYSAVTLMTILLFAVYLKKLITINWLEILTAYAKFIAASVIMIGTLVLSNNYIFGFGSTIISLGLQIILGGFVYLAVLYILKTRELLTVIKNIKI